MKSLSVGTFSICLLQYFDLAWVLNIFLVIIEPLLKYLLVYFFLFQYKFKWYRSLSPTPLAHSPGPLPRGKLLTFFFFQLSLANCLPKLGGPWRKLRQNGLSSRGKGSVLGPQPQYVEFLAPTSSHRVEEINTQQMYKMTGRRKELL